MSWKHSAMERWSLLTEKGKSQNNMYVTVSHFDYKMHICICSMKKDLEGFYISC